MGKWEVEEGSVVNVYQVFDGSHERSGCVDGGVGLIETYGGNVLDFFYCISFAFVSYYMAVLWLWF